MSQPFVQHQLGLLAFLCAQLLIALSNRFALRRLDRGQPSTDGPRVSVLVPARNEERNIDACVQSLLAQRYAEYQIIVLDDGSTDRTGAILAELQRTHSQLRVIAGQPLPVGWTGKNWACHQLAQEADGDLLLFVDADTRLDGDVLQQVVTAMANERADLLSALPRQEMATWAERLVIPIMPWSLFTLLPMAIAQRVRMPVLSAAIGQFMLFRRAAYDRLGGHASVRHSPVDDIALARRTKALGMRWRLFDGTESIHCRMYRSRGEVVQGVGRTLFAVFGNFVLLYLFVWIWLAIVYLEPVVLLVGALLGLFVAPASLWLAAMAVAAALALFLLTYHRLHVPVALAFLYPLTIAATVAVAGVSLYHAVTGRGTWKGRSTAAAP